MSADDATHSGPDRTMARASAGPGMDMSVLFACGHRGTKTGALLRPMGRGLQPWLVMCATCNLARKGTA